jgi:hypothetical protein
VQFIFDLIWSHSRSKYLIALSERETLIETSIAILGLFSFAIFAAHALDAYRTS